MGIGGAGFLESLDLAERVSDKSSRRRQGGLALSAGAGAWTLLASTPYRVASITVSWAARVEKLADYAREVSPPPPSLLIFYSGSLGNCPEYMKVGREIGKSSKFTNVSSLTFCMIVVGIVFSEIL